VFRGGILGRELLRFCTHISIQLLTPVCSPDICLHFLQPSLHLRVILILDFISIAQVVCRNHAFGGLLGEHETILAQSKFFLAAGYIFNSNVVGNLWWVWIVACITCQLLCT
jgi:hypothetical protein